MAFQKLDNKLVELFYSFSNLFDLEGPFRVDINQAGAQVAAVVVGVLMAVLFGVITGLILKLPIWDNLPGTELFDDETFWEVLFIDFKIRRNCNLSRFPTSTLT